MTGRIPSGRPPVAPTHNLARAFAKNALFKGGGELAIRLLSFAFVVLVARSLGDADFGVLNFATSFGLLFVVIVDFGLNPLLIRHTAAEPDKSSHYFFHYLGIKVVLGLLFLAAVYAGLALTAASPAMQRTALVLAVFILLNSFTEFFNAVFIGHQQMQYEAGIMTLQKTALLGLGLLALGLGWGLRGVAAAYAAAGGLGVLAAAAGLQRSGLLKKTWHWDRATIAQGLKQALPLTLTTLFINVYFRIDMTLLAKLRPAEEVGWYGAAHKCVEVLMVVPSVLVLASFPGFSKLAAEDRGRLARGFHQMMRMLMLLAAPLVVGSWLLGTPLMALVFGKSFSPAGPALAWLAVALGFIFLNFPLSYLLISAGKQSLNALVAGLAVVVSVGTNLLLIPGYGYLGAAGAAAVTEAFLFVCYWLAVRKTLFPVPVFSPGWRVLAAAVVMGLALWPLRLAHPVWLVGLGGVVYGAAAWMFRALGPGEWELFKKIIRKGEARA